MDPVRVNSQRIAMAVSRRNKSAVTVDHKRRPVLRRQAVTLRVVVPSEVAVIDVSVGEVLDVRIAIDLKRRSTASASRELRRGVVVDVRAAAWREVEDLLVAVGPAHR